MASRIASTTTSLVGPLASTCPTTNLEKSSSITSNQRRSGPTRSSGEIELPDRIAMRRLEPARALVADRAALAMDRRKAGLTEHPRDRLHRDPPAEEPLELSSDLRRAHRRVLLLVVEDRLGLVLAEPRTRIARRTRRRHARPRRRGRRDQLRHGRAARRDHHQPLPLGLLVPAPQRLRRAPDRGRHLIALHAGGDQRERVRMRFRREPPATRRHRRARASRASPVATRATCGLVRTVAVRSTTAHERLQPALPATWRPPSRRPGTGRDLRI